MCPRPTSSMESAITSRLMSEAFIPSVPIVTPSEMATVFSSIGTPPASRIPALTSSASRRKPRLQGIVSIHECATPTIGFLKSSSPSPIARSIERAPARSRPSMIVLLLCRVSNFVGVSIMKRSSYRVMCMLWWFWRACYHRRAIRVEAHRSVIASV